MRIDGSTITFGDRPETPIANECHRTGVQPCHCCDDEHFGDNLNPVALRLRADLARSRRRERQLRRAVLAHAGMRCYGRMVDARIQCDYARESGGAIAESVAARWDERAKQQYRIGAELMRRARDAASDGEDGEG